MNTTNILDSNTLKYLTQAFFSIAENLWNKYFKMANITKYSKAWWNEKCNRNLATYHMSRRKINWISYKKMVRIAKCIFFDNKIQEIASTNKRPFNHINWAKKWKLPTTEAIKFNRISYNNLDNLWQVLHQSYNTAQDKPINIQLLDEIPMC